MDLIRIGNKLVSREKIITALDMILEERAAGATQREAAHEVDVPRTFVSNLETLGELRQGARIAIIAFPISNGKALRELAVHYGVEFTLIFSQEEREHAGGNTPADLFNRTLDTIAALQDFDVAIVLASDYRIETIKRILDIETIGICLGTSPLTENIVAPIDEVEALLKGFEEGLENSDEDTDQPGRLKRMRTQGRRAISGATRLVREWDQSKR